MSAIAPPVSSLRPNHTFEVGGDAKTAQPTHLTRFGPRPSRLLLCKLTYQQHLNYAAIGQTQPEFPGGFTSNHSLQGTPEFAYGLTDWWEAGFYLPFAVSGTGEFLSDGAKIRSLFVTPDAEKRNFFYGVNFELSYELPPFAASPWALEIRPIIGVRNKEWEFIVNPIVDCQFWPRRRSRFCAGGTAGP
jgi:hypothetical protein